MSENLAQKIIDGSMADARELYAKEWVEPVNTIMGQIIGSGIMRERARCIAILQSIEPHNPSESHLLETIARRVRGEE